MNTTMYSEFKRIAVEDSSHSYKYGMECLFRFFSYGLEKAFRLEVYKDFEEMTLLVGKDVHRTWSDPEVDLVVFWILFV